MVTFVFGNAFEPERFARSQAYRELDRVLAVYERDRPVASASSYSFQLAVPGSADVAAAGVSGVAVLPTHRRRGVLSALMRRQLDDVHERGEPLAILWASEAPIYGRFGYGLGTLGLSWELAPRDSAFSPSVPAGGPGLRLLALDQAAEVLPPVYERLRRTTPGMTARSPAWWQARRLYSPGQELACVIAEDGRACIGYALYTVSGRWEAVGPDNTVATAEVVATTDDGYRALWRFLLDIDLARKVTAWERPVDEPLRWMLADPRALQGRVVDGLWVRLVDVPNALAARRYRTDIRAVLEVTDPFCPWNEGRWLLEGGPDGATCSRAGRRGHPDLTVSAADLGALYLGGVTIGPLVRAGRIVEGRRGAADAAGRAFGWDPAPWASTFF